MFPGKLTTRLLVPGNSFLGHCLFRRKGLSSRFCAGSCTNSCDVQVFVFFIKLDTRDSIASFHISCCTLRGQKCFRERRENVFILSKDKQLQILGSVRITPLLVLYYTVCLALPLVPVMGMAIEWGLIFLLNSCFSPLYRDILRWSLKMYPRKLIWMLNVQIEETKVDTRCTYPKDHSPKIGLKNTDFTLSSNNW